MSENMSEKKGGEFRHDKIREATTAEELEAANANLEANGWKEVTQGGNMRNFYRKNTKEKEETDEEKK